METFLKDKKLNILVIVLLVAISLFTIAKFVNEVKANRYIGHSSQVVNTISFSGKGEVTAVPDIASLNVNITISWYESNQLTAWISSVDERYDRRENWGKERTMKTEAKYASWTDGGHGGIIRANEKESRGSWVVEEMDTLDLPSSSALMMMIMISFCPYNQ